MNLSDEYKIINPSCCNAPFAVPASTLRNWKESHCTWHCPHCGRRRYYPELTDEEKRIRELQQQLSSTQVRAVAAESRARTKQRQYERIRDRVKNGVCPCCNRTFQNVARHMATQHPEFGERGTFRQIRLAFGLTQTEAGEEIGLSATTISHYENGAFVSSTTREAIDGWLEQVKAS